MIEFLEAARRPRPRKLRVHRASSDYKPISPAKAKRLIRKGKAGPAVLGAAGRGLWRLLALYGFADWIFEDVPTGDGVVRFLREGILEKSSRPIPAFRLPHVTKIWARRHAKDGAFEYDYVHGEMHVWPLDGDADRLLRYLRRQGLRPRKAHLTAEDFPLEEAGSESLSPEDWEQLNTLNFAPPELASRWFRWRYGGISPKSRIHAAMSPAPRGILGFLLGEGDPVTQVLVAQNTTIHPDHAEYILDFGTEEAVHALFEFNRKVAIPVEPLFRILYRDGRPRVLLRVLNYPHLPPQMAPAILHAVIHIFNAGAGSLKEDLPLGDEWSGARRQIGIVARHILNATPHTERAAREKEEYLDEAKLLLGIDFHRLSPPEVSPVSSADLPTMSKILSIWSPKET